MSKPFYKSRKFWTAVITAAAALAMLVSGGEKGQAYATVIITLGGLLLAGFGLEDVGKSGKAMELQNAVELANVLKTAKEESESILEVDTDSEEPEKEEEGSGGADDEETK